MDTINFGIGFVTGRENICNLLNTYYKEIEMQAVKYREIFHTQMNITIFIAYDTEYIHTPAEKFYQLSPECANEIPIIYITPAMIKQEKQRLIDVFSFKCKNVDLFLGNGYARGRNVIMYYALLRGMDYLMFWDDDEYPLACVYTEEKISWIKQNNVLYHAAAMQTADISAGYHCGYISPIPYIPLNRVLNKKILRSFVNAITNEIIDWESLYHKMQKTNGVTYAERTIIGKRRGCQISFNRGAKWVPGSSLCLNLRHIQGIPAFYNPPAARGEDTFFSLRLHNVNVVRVPMYHFHDAFLSCQSVMKGVFPEKLPKIPMDTLYITQRFLTASLGWLRYKPLFVYLTQPRSYKMIMQQTWQSLKKSERGMAAVLGTESFNTLIDTFTVYAKHVQNHYQEYMMVNALWESIKEYVQLHNVSIEKR